MLGPESVLTSGRMKMPVIGLGTWQSPSDEVEKAVETALEAGYRHIDTAYLYNNEGAIGRVLKKVLDEGKLKREDIFVVTKLPMIGNRPEDVEHFLKKSLGALQLDYVDLYLIHSPVGLVNKEGHPMPRDENGKFLIDPTTDLLATWKAMEAQVKAGRTKCIGVSNFNKKQIQRILDECCIIPANLQVELHIYLQQKELVSFCKENGVVVCAYAPLGSPALRKFAEENGRSTTGFKTLVPLEDPVIVEIAKNHNKKPSQVLLRYLLQYGVAVIPKSVNPERIRENINIFDFELSKEEFESISALDRGEEGRIFGASLYGNMAEHPEFPLK